MVNELNNVKNGLHNQSLQLIAADFPHERTIGYCSFP